MTQSIATYHWENAEATDANANLLPVVSRLIDAQCKGRSLNILDIGCGNGFVAGQIATKGHRLFAVDSSSKGIDIVQRTYPSIVARMQSLYDDTFGDFVDGPVECVIALEVIEHLFYPRVLFEKARRMLKDKGSLIISTPYHGYFKNLALSVTAGWDRHFTVDWDGGHIKFFSRRTLRRMASECGFEEQQFIGVGRLPGLWKSMVVGFR